MRRLTRLLSVVIVVLLGTVVLRTQPGAIAQEATPASSEEMMPEGITFEPVAFALGVEVASPADLFVARVGLDPGAGFPIEDSDPSAGILVVESGTFTVQVEGPVTVTRGAGLAEAMATAETTGDSSGASEAIAAGEAVTLAAGDAAYIPGSINGEIRNDGQERAVGLAFLVGPPEDMMAEATPAAEASAPTVAVSLSEFTIEMPMELPAGPTTFAITNAGTVEHNFEVEGQGIEEELPENLAPGASGTLTLDLTPGVYEVYCPVGHHADEGMRVELTVTE
ncbi:MAG: cupredoxin domain-containing protein [Nocardioidaceae bacterium]|nr:cupredoxin domain-containing protein [Nocardioidaceae bacterium]